MGIDTGELLKILTNIHQADELTEITERYFENKPDLKLYEYLNELMEQHSLEKSNVIIKSNLPRTYAYQIFNGTRRPGKDKLLALCLAMHLNLEETQRALSIADVGCLYPRRKRDAIILFSIDKGLGPDQANLLLSDYGEPLIE